MGKDASGPRKARAGGPHTTPAGSRWMTVAQVAVYCGVSVWTVRRWIAEGRLPHTRRDGKRGHYRILRMDVYKLLRELEGNGGDAGGRKVAAVFNLLPLGQLLNDFLAFPVPSVLVVIVLSVLTFSYVRSV